MNITITSMTNNNLRYNAKNNTTTPNKSTFLNYQSPSDSYMPKNSSPSFGNGNDVFMALVREGTIRAGRELAQWERPTDAVSEIGELTAKSIMRRVESMIDKNGFVVPESSLENLGKSIDDETLNFVDKLTRLILPRKNNVDLKTDLDSVSRIVSKYKEYPKARPVMDQVIGSGKFTLSQMGDRALGIFGVGYRGSDSQNKIIIEMMAHFEGLK